MADVKISALPAATTPLAGTEVLPIVQSSTTKKVAISDVTAGRAISASSLTLTTPLAVGSGGTGTSTAFTAGSVVFAGASGTYSQDNANFFWDDTNNRLGIGTNSPSGFLANKLVVATGGTANEGITIYSSSNNGSLWFADGTTGSQSYAGGIDYSHSADTLVFYSNASGNMRLDASGNLGIGTASPSGILHTYATNGVNWFESPGISSVSLQFKTNSSNRFRIGIPSASADLAFWSDAGSTEVMRIDTSGNLSVVGNFVMGTADKGIDFSINSSAAGMTSELLNDYETGTWTPTYVSSTGAFGAITYNSLTYGRYTKIGNTVIVLGLIATDAVNAGTAAGLVYIAGLPFTPATSASSGINYSSAFNTNNPSGGYTSSARIYPTYRATANGGSTGIQAGDIDTVAGALKNYVIFQATYVV